jgi:hypothetical protein
LGLIVHIFLLISLVCWANEWAFQLPKVSKK